MQVEGLNDRMVDVDSNLNYMLGQLSLVVQEFNQVHSGRKLARRLKLFMQRRSDADGRRTRAHGTRTEVHSTN